MTTSITEMADAQLQEFEDLTSLVLRRPDKLPSKPKYFLQDIDKEYLRKFTKFDELPLYSLYFVVDKDPIYPQDKNEISCWAQYYPNGFMDESSNEEINHRYADIGDSIAAKDYLQPTKERRMKGWEYNSYDFYLFVPPSKTKPFLNWKQNNPWEVKP